MSLSSIDFGPEPLALCRTLQEAGYDAVVVGGPVRDGLAGREASDVDLATSATPDEVHRIFRKTFSQGNGERHGTVGVIAPSGTVYEVTTYRLDVETDGRWAGVRFTDSLNEDLQRRDFTINAMAARPGEDGWRLVDPYGGRADLEDGVLRAVGDPGERFREDVLRVLRGYRFAARFGFRIDDSTRDAMRDAAGRLSELSAERVYGELTKLGRQSTNAGAVRGALASMAEDGVLATILPELEAARGVEQNDHHGYDVFGHLSAAAGEAAARSSDSRLFLAALLHDVGKPQSRWVDDDGVAHFYENPDAGTRDHAEVGAEMAAAILRRLRAPNAVRHWVTEAVRQHMRLLAATPALEHSPRSGRRALARIRRDVSVVTLDDLLDLRIIDKAASGVPGKALSEEFVATVRARIRELDAADRAFRVTDLAIGGRDLMALGMEAGPAMGRVLRGLLDDVVEERVPNEPDALRRRVLQQRRRRRPSR